MADERRRLLGLSWFQLIAGALAAMTAAWIASALGVAGTIIGAAVGSLVASVTAALYSNTLDRGRTLIVQTNSGDVVETHPEPGETSVALDAVREATHSEIKGATFVERPKNPWKTVVISTVAILALAAAAMGGYELATDQSYGVKSDNARLGNPFGGTAPTAEPTNDPEPTSSPTPTVTEPTPTPTPTDEPAPTPSPSVSADPQE